jgi:hypothetical protein
MEPVLVQVIARSSQASRKQSTLSTRADIDKECFAISKDDEDAGILLYRGRRYLHDAEVSGEMKTIKIHVPLVYWLASDGVKVPSCNTWLHDNLCGNFSATHNELSPSDIKSTGLSD